MIGPTKFQKRIEDFVCEYCNREVKGNGYTNHCPHCLWSKHVDIHPGDRLSPCQGLMKPTKLVNEKGDFIITNICIICEYEKRNRLAVQDNFDAALEAVRKKE